MPNLNRLPQFFNRPHGHKPRIKLQKSPSIVSHSLQQTAAWKHHPYSHNVCTLIRTPKLSATTAPRIFQRLTCPEESSSKLSASCHFAGYYIHQHSSTLRMYQPCPIWSRRFPAIRSVPTYGSYKPPVASFVPEELERIRSRCTLSWTLSSSRGSTSPRASIVFPPKKL